jgi:lipopolysaccharide heptosyltransferase I
VNILIVKMSAIGDVVHTLPALNALRQTYPDAKIDWLVEDTAADLLLGHRALDRVLIWPRRTFVRLIKRGRLLRARNVFFDTFQELRATPYNLIIDFQALLKSSLWVFLARGRRKAGFDRGMAHAENSQYFLNERVPAVSMEIHALDRGLKLLEYLGIPTTRIIYDIPVRKEDERIAEALLKESPTPPDQPLIAVNPVAKWPTKLWPPERFREVAERLSHHGCRVAFTGSGDDRKLIDEICRPMKVPILRLDGRTSLKTLAALYHRAKAVITTDTGPMHLAAAVGTPVVALFGPTAPWRTGPYGEDHVAVRVGLSCSPCFRRRCHTNEFEKMACMRRIPVGKIVGHVLKLIA